MGVPEIKAADAARPAVVRFLWETNSELDDPVVDYLSEIIFDEAMQHKNGKSMQAVTESLHLFLPSLRINGLEGRVQNLLEQIRSNVAAAAKPKDEYQDYWSFSPSSSSSSLNPAIKRTLSTFSNFSNASSADVTSLNPHNSSGNNLATSVPGAAKEGGKSPSPAESAQGLSRPASSCSVASQEKEKDGKELSAKDLSGTSVESDCAPGGALAVVGVNGNLGGENKPSVELQGVPVPIKGVKGFWGGAGGLAGLDTLGFTSFNVSESAPGKIETLALFSQSMEANVGANAHLPEDLVKTGLAVVEAEVKQGLGEVEQGLGEVTQGLAIVRKEHDIFECSPKSPLSDLTSPSSLESLSSVKKDAPPGFALVKARQPDPKSSPSASSSDDEGLENFEKSMGGEGKAERGSPWSEEALAGLTSLQLAALRLNPNAAEFVPPQSGKTESGVANSSSGGSQGAEIPAILAPRKIHTSGPDAKLSEEIHFGEESLPKDLLKMSDEMLFGADLARGSSPSTLSGGSHSPGGRSRGLSHPPSPYEDILRGAEMNRSISMSSMRGEGMPMRGADDGRRSHDDLRRAQYEAERRLHDDLSRLPRLDLEIPEEGRFDPRFRGARTLPEYGGPDFGPREPPLFHRRGSESSLGIPPSPRRDPMFVPPFRGPPSVDHSPPGGSPRFAMGPSPTPFAHRTPSRENLRGPPPFGFNRPFDGPPPPDYLGEPLRPGFGEFFDGPPPRGRFDDGPPRYERGFDHPPFPSPRGGMRPDFDPAFGPRSFSRGFPSPRGPPAPHAFDFPPSPMRGGPMRGPPIEDTGPDPVQVLAAEFPGFPAEGLAEIFFSNGCDLALTMEMLTQLEVQEGNSAVGRRQAPAPPPSLGMNDFPALGGSEPPFPSHREAREADVQDFAAAVRKAAAAQNPANRWAAYDAPPPRRNDFSRGVPRGESPPPWLETGDAVAGLYGQLRDEARDYARARNACFEQATAAYLAGNKALAKQLSAKGQWHNERMKAAHARAGEAIFAERNTRRSGDPPMLDLHGLHVAEAIPILKRELAALKAQAAHTRQRQQLYVVVGTGHHTKGARTPARLPFAVEQFLQEERVNFSEPQPGLLRVLI